MIDVFQPLHSAYSVSFTKRNLKKGNHENFSSCFSEDDPEKNETLHLLEYKR